MSAGRSQSLRLTLTSAPRCPVQRHLALTVLEGPHHSVRPFPHIGWLLAAWLVITIYSYRQNIK